jgi:hypothetical protein
MRWEVNAVKNDHHRHAFALAVVASERVSVMRNPERDDYRQERADWAGSWEAA